jgi:uncharacterized protein
MITILVYIIVAVLMLAGIVGSFLPLLPGPPLIVLGALIYGFYDKFDKVDFKIIGFLILLALISFVLDFISGALGAKKAKVSSAAIGGTILGGLVGLIFFNFGGLIVGTFLGAFIAELIFAKKGGKQALKAGLSSLIGFLAGAAVKVLIAIIMVIFFLLAVF